LEPVVFVGVPAHGFHRLILADVCFLSSHFILTLASCWG